MKKYKVEIFESYRYHIEVEAESEEDALERVRHGEGEETSYVGVDFEMNIVDE